MKLEMHQNALRRTIAPLEVSAYGGGALRSPAPGMARLRGGLESKPDRPPAFRRFLAWLAKVEW